MSNSRAEPRLIELQTRRSQQDINVVPQRENTEHAAGESDADDYDEHSEDAESDFDQAKFEGRKIKTYYFRVPKSSQECPVKFTSLQPVLENFMNEHYEEFFTSLFVSCYGNGDDVLEIPHMNIRLPSGDTSFASIDQFPLELREADIVHRPLPCPDFLAFRRRYESQAALPRTSAPGFPWDSANGTPRPSAS